MDMNQELKNIVNITKEGVIPVARLLEVHEFREAVALALQLLQVTCHRAASEAGWWHDPKTGQSIKENNLCFGNKLLLVHSEISEAMEGDRKSLPDDKLPHHPMRTVELGDALIRILDTAGGFDLRLAEATVDKLVFNTVRPDHKVSARLAESGKAY